MKVAVLMGGTSVERQVSLATGRAVLEALRDRGHETYAVDTARGYVPRDEEERLLGQAVGREPPDEEALLEAGRGELSLGVADVPVVEEADVAFLALHGGQGEDGRLQAVLDVAGVRYTGSGHLGSAVAMDKRVSKELLERGGVPTPAWSEPGAGPERIQKELGTPVVVKPAAGGSTVGVTVVREPAELSAALDRAVRWGEDPLAERYVPGREITVGVLGGEALPVVEIHPGPEIYDYESKYTPGLSHYDVPADLDPGQVERVQELALRAYRLLRQESYSRIDFLLSEEDDRFYCLEANSLPGMTSTSLLPKAAAAAGIPFPELCERIARDAL